MEIFKQLSKKGYKHYYEGTVEELDSMDKNNPDLHSEIMQVIMWLYEKHRIWIDVSLNQFSKPKDLQWMYSIVFTQDCTYSHSPKSYNSPTEAYEAAIEYCLTKLI